MEYLLCKCRKYYRYVNGTKSYKGKIVKSGKSPMLTLAAKSLNEECLGMQVNVIPGGPSFAKTTLLKALKEKGFTVIPETAEEVIRLAVKARISVEEQRLMDPIGFQLDLLKRDFALFDDVLSGKSQLLSSGDSVMADTSFDKTLVFSEHAGIKMIPTVEEWIRKKRYNIVFFLSSPELRTGSYETSAVRMESHSVALQISQEIQAAYRRYGYELVVVPTEMTVAEKCDFVERRVMSA